MALSKEQLKDLAADLSAVMGELPPIPVELVCATGELFSDGAMKLARCYERATNGQRDALDQICKAFEVTP